MNHNESPTPAQPIQFGLAKLLQFMTVAALWCGAVIVRENVLLGMAYTVVVVAATWTVVGRWAVRLSPQACRRVLSATTTLLVAGGFGMTMLVGDDRHFPLIWMLTVPVALAPWVLTGVSVVLGAVAGLACNVLLLLVIYYVWLAVFGSWERLAARPDPRRLAWSFGTLLVILALPILLSIWGGCYAFREHGEVNEFHHQWLHCVIHVAMLAAAVTVAVLLWRHARRSTAPPPHWLKLTAWGYLCFYAVLLQVALFPVHFYIP